jgi:hypothetical protein
MPQNINLNTSPYFDDFNLDDEYYKVLVKPEKPIQARELNNLQSILQNQIEQFGNHIFKEGSVVIPGQLSYDNPFYAVEIDSEYNGVPVSLYFDQIVGKRLRGSSSGVLAQVVYSIPASQSERNSFTLYVIYLESGGSDFSNKTFVDGETLRLESNLTYGNFTLQAGQGAFNTIASNSNSLGSSVKIASGVYFVRGVFAKVNEQRLLLDQYGSTPSYKVGFNIVESIVTADEDNRLYDNANGFSNYAAPGADRLKITLELAKKSLDDTEVNDFVEILRVVKGVPEFFDKKPNYSLIRDELARRTFDSSGDYYVSPFTVFVRESLNDRLSTNGVYYADQTTVSGSIPSEDKLVYQIGPGKAYVNGYDVETISSTLLDIEKPRQTKDVLNETIPYNAGTLFLVNNSYGSPAIGLGTDATVSLIDSRIGSTKHVSVGTTIGVARVYDYVSESDYLNDASRSELRLFDVQTFTKVGFTTTISTLKQSDFVKGKKSNASGFVRSITGNTATLYEVSGSFLRNEPITINGIDNGTLINSITDYSISDVKSVYTRVGVSTFNADLVLDKKSFLAPSGTNFSITQASAGISTVSIGLGTNFAGLLKSGDIISYNNSSTGYLIYNKVETISPSTNNFTLSALTTVVGVATGDLPTSNLTTTNLVKISPNVLERDSALITPLNKINVSNLSLNDNELKQRRYFSNVSFSNSRITITITEQDLFFDGFDEDKFLITYSDGTLEKLRSDKYSLDNTGKVLTFNGLSKASGTANVVATIKNIKPSSKIKKLNTVGILTVDKSKHTASGIGTTTLNDGLTYSSVYGVRVQDDTISLNIPDVARVLAIYESTTIGDASLPSLQVTGTPNNANDFKVGENFIGESSGAIGIVARIANTNTIEYVNLNTISFTADEIIVGQDTGSRATITIKTLGDLNITSSFGLDDGQRDSIYDYSRIIRSESAVEPKSKLKIVYQNYDIDSSDTGELITVNSYPNTEFKYIKSYNGVRLNDCIDIRPRVSTYTLNSKSPFEFDSRRLDGAGQYSSYPLVPNENLVLSYSYYLPRVDRVYLNQDGTFEVDKGIPSENPLPNSQKSNSLNIAEIYLPAYVYNAKNVIVNMKEHKRYRMEDISLLEDRIERVEKYTTLSMLESKTENFTIKDAETGLDRFKCGFFVDNFSSHAYHDYFNSEFKACIDTKTNTLRPLHYTTSLDLQLGSEALIGIGQTYNANADQSYVSDLGSPNVRKTGELITLDYNETLYFNQPFATRTESVTPFLVSYWEGSITLSPQIDTWFDEKVVTTNTFNEVRTTVDITLDTPVQNEIVFTEPVTTQSGVPPFDWIANARSLIPTLLGGKKAKKSQGTGIKAINVSDNSITATVSFQAQRARPEDLASIYAIFPEDVATKIVAELRQKVAGEGRRSTAIGTFTFTPSSTTPGQSVTNTTTVIIPEQVTETETTSQSISNYTQPVQYLRSRNIDFDIRGLRPITRFYSFFEGVDVNKYIIPKLLEIEMVSGRFEIGETVESDPNFISNKIRFRVAKPNHKSGPYDGSSIPNSIPAVVSLDQNIDGTFSETVLEPSQNLTGETYLANPYTLQTIQETYSLSSTFVNIDIKSLQLPSETNFFGCVSEGMRIIGKTSGAVAIVKPIRLVSDSSGRLIGALFIPDPAKSENPRWINGKNTFAVSDSKTLSSVNIDLIIANQRSTQSGAEIDFYSSSVNNVTETNILTTRNVRIVPSRTVTTTTTTPGSSTSGSLRVGEITVKDPLAQSFYVNDDTGIFLTSIEVFFETKDETIPVTLQLRTMNAGVPSTVVIPFSEVTLDPSDINVSLDGSISTKFRFPSPVYLQGPQIQEVRNSPVGSQRTQEYAVVILSDSPNYRVFISQMGENDLQSGARISQQPTLGSLFKSQNSSTWSPSQLEDLKFKLNRANFKSEGLVRFFNPNLSLGNKKATVTNKNQITQLSKKVIVALSSTNYDASVIVPGITLVQDSARGTLVGIGGSVRLTSGISTSQIGFGYTGGTFTGVDLITETGYGKGAKATVIVNQTTTGIGTVTITSGGFGYQIGDSLAIPSIGQNVGTGAKITVTAIGSSNAFVIDGVQNTFAVGITTLSYTTSIGTTSVVGSGVTIAEIVQDPYYDGLHMKISHKNHGMHSSENYVNISQMRPMLTDTNTSLTAAVTSSEITTINVVSTSGFGVFEGVGVSTTNPGYAIIGNEVIEYTTYTATTLSGLTRAIDGTQAISYTSNTKIYKYELNGVSLRRINKTHNFANVDLSTHPIELDSYFVKIDTSDSDEDGNIIGVDRSGGLYFNSTKQVGEAGTVLTNNIQFEAITPNIATLLPAKTNLSSKIRTYTGTSINGDETSFRDSGFVDVPLSGTTYFNSPRVICSSVNESRFITDAPANKSFSMEMLLSTSDSRISPVIDTIRTSVILTSNLLNSPIDSDYSQDERIRALVGDPHACVYLSQPVTLKIPANSLKVILSASRNDTNDIRVFYQLFRVDSVGSNFELFPGYSNYQVDGVGIKRVIDSALNDGSADTFVRQSSDQSLKDYEYSVDDLPDFYAFAIKIVMAGTNQATPPIIKDLRAIATVKPQL